MEPQYPLIFFTLFICLGAGLMAFQGWYLFKGKGSRKFHLTAVIVEAIVFAVGGVASFLHLHHWERIFNGFGHLTSGITQELIGIVVSYIVLIIMFVMLRRAGADDGTDDDEAAPAPAGRLVAPWVGILALVVGIVMGFICAHSYAMPSRPAWENPMLYLYYYSSEFVLGAAGLWALMAIMKEDADLGSQMATMTLVAGIVSAIVIIACGFVYSTISFDTVGIAFHTTDPTAAAKDPAAVMSSPLTGAYAPLFWVGAVAVGSIVAALCGLLGKKNASRALPASIVALVCALVGGVCFRVVLYVVGITYYVYF